MTDHTDLNAQIAQVWAWVAGAMPYERTSKDHRRGEITFILCPDEQYVRCDISYGWSGIGATWQEALCRAAVALEEAR